MSNSKSINRGLELPLVYRTDLQNLYSSLSTKVFRKEDFFGIECFPGVVFVAKKGIAYPAWDDIKCFAEILQFRRASGHLPSSSFLKKHYTPKIHQKLVSTLEFLRENGYDVDINEDIIWCEESDIDNSTVFNTADCSVSTLPKETEQPDKCRFVISFR